jgi:ParB/RepB/Spo0J family partition protein
VGDGVTVPPPGGVSINEEGLMAITPPASVTVELDRIRVPENVRPLDGEHVSALARSIELQGMLVPIVVCPLDDGAAVVGFDYELVAGFHRLAAAQKLGLAAVPALVRESAGEQADRAVENIARLQLGPVEEAAAVAAMLEKGLSEDGAAQALGWPKARVAARMKLLELPERAQQLIAAGVIALSAVDQLRAIGRVSPRLLDAVIEFIAEGNEWAGERLAREPGWVLDAALRNGARKVFAAHLSQLDTHEIPQLRLGKKTEELLEEAGRLHRQLDRHAYGPPAIRFSEQDVDQARAAGVLIEFERSRPVIVDRALYRELAKAAIKRTVEEARDRAAQAAAEKKRAAKTDAAAAADPVELARRAHQRQLRELAEQAHGANLDLGAALMNGLAAVDPADMTVARFFVYALLGPDHDGSPYTQSGELIAELAVRGIRLLLDESRADVTRTRKDGTRGKLRIDYGDPRQPEKPIAWVWRFIDGARTASELYGRALVVIAAEQYASRLVVPASQQFRPKRWPSHKDQAAKALRKLAGPHLPTTLKQLEKAVAAAKQEHDRAQEQARAQQRRRAGKRDASPIEAERPEAAAGGEDDEQLEVEQPDGEAASAAHPGVEDLAEPGAEGETGSEADVRL